MTDLRLVVVMLVALGEQLGVERRLLLSSSETREHREARAASLCLPFLRQSFKLAKAVHDLVAELIREVDVVQRLLLQRG